MKPALACFHLHKPPPAPRLGMGDCLRPPLHFLIALCSGEGFIDCSLVDKLPKSAPGAPLPARFRRRGKSTTGCRGRAGLRGAVAEVARYEVLTAAKRARPALRR